MEEILKHIQNYYEQRDKLLDVPTEVTRKDLEKSYGALRDELVQNILKISGIEEHTLCRLKDYFNERPLIFTMTSDIESGERIIDKGLTKFSNDSERKAHSTEFGLNNRLDSIDASLKIQQKPELGHDCSSAPQTYMTPNNASLPNLIADSSKLKKL